MTNDNPTPPPAEPNGPAYGGAPGHPQQQPYPPAPPAYSGAPTAYPGQQYGAYGAPQYSQEGDYPGKTLGIVGLVFAFVFALAGIIISAIALNQSKQAGFKNTPAKVGLILSIIFTVIGLIGIVLWFLLIAWAISEGAVSGY